MKRHEPFRVLRRGEATITAMREVLDGLGIENGEDFAVVRAPEGEDAELKFISDSTTSRKAAVHNYPRADTQRHRCLMVVAEHNRSGSTREQISEATGLPPNIATPRVVELLDAGLITATGRTRMTIRGCEADILVLTPRGRDEVLKREGWMPEG